QYSESPCFSAFCAVMTSIYHDKNGITHGWPARFSGRQKFQLGKQGIKLHILILHGGVKHLVSRRNIDHEPLFLPF
ncbi:MAG: hypothetical protein ACN6N0_17255, partial [Microvirgula sp.]